MCKCGEEMVCKSVERDNYLEYEYYSCENCGQTACLTWNKIDVEMEKDFVLEESGLWRCKGCGTTFENENEYNKHFKESKENERKKFRI